METISDIVAEIREAEKTWSRSDIAQLPTQYLKEWSDRIEAAAKREREAGAEAAQICGEIGEAIGRGNSGNAAAMREALEELVGVIDKCNSGNPLWWHIGAKGVKPLKDARAALSSPPRNCDRFATLDDARNAFFADYVPDETCSSATAFAIWIFDESKGETDGSK